MHSINELINYLNEAIDMIANNEYRKAQSTIAYVVFYLKKSAQQSVQPTGGTAPSKEDDLEK